MQNVFFGGYLVVNLVLCKTNLDKEPPFSCFCGGVCKTRGSLVRCIKPEDPKVLFADFLERIHDWFKRAKKTYAWYPPKTKS